MYATSQDYLKENPKMPFNHLVALLKRHNYSLKQFTDEMGTKEEYDTEEVLGWMGY